MQVNLAASGELTETPPTVKCVVVPEGLEPPTPTLGKWRSIRLSYGTTLPAH
jgi:hypothetical protein